ncbi:hypothetical protein FGG08_001187 [Glutinoglossum americanum]|uniref:RING-type domain-containing protein n=1 Tax=Glutinoglossum americanum TaxID=1670608 RepID=A0A9P8I8Q9_9PEZI|nr:hypothetical protein FGG08_001187 [Glutinoglossum americanum]
MEGRSDTNMGCMVSHNSTNEITNNDRHENQVSAGEGQPQAQPHIEATTPIEAPMDTGTTDGSGADATTQPGPIASDGRGSLPTCTACDVSLEPEDTIKPRCEHSYCIFCVKSMFIAACKDESSMPPRCCTAIPLGIALPYLTKEQATLYREKFEEWHTTDRVYCPVQSCSAFIPNRLLPTPPASPKQVNPDEIETTKQSLSDGANTGGRDEEPTVVTFGTGVVMEVHKSTPMQPSDSKGSHTGSEASNNSAISCPRCEVAICVSCKRLSHPDTPCGEDPDQWITEFLRKYKLKRCPKCRNAVKKMFGCDHIRCRCGAQWCWACCRRIDVCESEGCLGDEHEELDDAEDDLDAGDWQYEDFTGIGDEPDRNIQDPWNCDHAWRKVRWTAGEPEPPEMECNRCFRGLCVDPRPKPTPMPPIGTAPADADTVMADRDTVATGMSTGTTPTPGTNDQGNGKQPALNEATEVDEEKIAWRCYCSLLICRSCIGNFETFNPGDIPPLMSTP